MIIFLKNIQIRKLTENLTIKLAIVITIINYI